MQRTTAFISLVNSHKGHQEVPAAWYSRLVVYNRLTPLTAALPVATCPLSALILTKYVTF